MLEFLSERVLGVFDATNTYLVFNDDGTDVLIAKKPTNVDISWDSLSDDNLVYGNTVLEIDGSYYTIALLRGSNSHVTVSDIYYGYNTTEHQCSDWNRLMYPIHSTTHSEASNVNTSDMGTLAQYSDADLLVHYTNGDGNYSWCQEVSGESSTYRILRGYGGVPGGSRNTSSNTSTDYGWRPLLTKLDIGNSYVRVFK